jgi:dTMP kinase
MFVTFEGPEGAGKSTLIRSLTERLRDEGLTVVATREPGSGEVGQAIREILLHGSDLDPKCELFLFLADRSQHVGSVIRPALERGEWVLCDRFADSTVVYQGYGRGLDLQQLRDWNAFATSGLTPDLIFLLDVDPVVGLERIKSKDRLDAEPLEFHMRIRNGFLSESRIDPDRWVVLDASISAAELLEQSMRVIRKRREMSNCQP